MKNKDYKKTAKEIADKIILLNLKYSQNYASTLQKNDNHDLNRNMASKI